MVTQLVHEVRTKAAGRSIAFVSGNFNTVHPGHLRLLRFAADCAEYLVVGVNNNSTAGTLLPQELRLEGIQSIGLVNHALLLPSTPEDFISALRPHTVVKGREHAGRHNPEQGIVESYGGRLIFSSGEMRFSSMDLLRQEILETNLSTILRPRDFMVRHSIAMSDLRSVMKRFDGMRVTVVGDLIVDDYITCDPVGMSQEDPTIVVTPIKEDRFLGGAAIVASHARKLGANVRFVSVAGCDQAAAYARSKLAEYGVSAEIFEDESRPTTLKQRYRASGKTLLRVSHLRQHEVSPSLSGRLVNAVTAELSQTDLIIFSDFNYGCLPQPVVDQVIEAASAQDVPMVADSQSSSQIGDITRFRNMLLMTPTEREARLGVRDQSSGLVVLAEELRRKTSATNIVMTLGAEGVIGHAASANSDGWLTDRLPALNTAPKDVAGAGDSLLTTSSLALVAGASLWEAIFLGSIAAACQVGRIGNIPLSRSEIDIELVD